MSDLGYRFDLTAEEMPRQWYNILADLPYEIPRDISLKNNSEKQKMVMQVPMELIRQSMGKQRYVDIPDEVLSAYRQWRPSTLVRAVALEKALNTPARIYYKYEGNNISGSHKLTTAIAQVYYYKKAGVKRVTTGTGAGQWGSALSVACKMFGLECLVFMVGISYKQKPYRKILMKMNGAEIYSSPSEITEAGRKFLALNADAKGNIALAIAEAIEATTTDNSTRFCIGSGEPYSILHQTLIGLEAKLQMQKADDYPDFVVGCLGAGSNFGGLTFPFLQDRLVGDSKVRCISVEPASCPKLTRGEYRYDFTDSSGVTPMEKMYTLGHDYVTPDIHAGGLRYHATSKLVSAIYHHGDIEAVAYQQREVFKSGVLFSQTEGIIPAPESAHAVHGAIELALAAKENNEAKVILVGISGHGHFDMSAYESYLAGELDDVNITDRQIRDSLDKIPDISALLDQ